jgi:hypothetical protein
MKSSSRTPSTQPNPRRELHPKRPSNYRRPTRRTSGTPRLRTEKMMLTISFLELPMEVSGGLIPLRKVKPALAWRWVRCYTPVKPM